MCAMEFRTNHHFEIITLIHLNNRRLLLLSICLKFDFKFKYIYKPSFYINSIFSKLFHILDTFSLLCFFFCRCIKKFPSIYLLFAVALF